MIKYVKSIAKYILNKLPMRNIIVFESNPELACNTYPVYKELERRGFNNKYKFIWMVEDKKKYKSTGKLSYMNYEPKNFVELVQRIYVFKKARALIYSNRFLGKHSEKQLSLYLTHGTLVKKLGTYQIHNSCDYCVSQVAELDHFLAKELDLDKDKIVVLGSPRTDELNIKNNCLKDMGFDEYDKCILWMPTFRKHNVSQKVDGEIFGLGIPLILDEVQLNDLNAYLNSKNILLIVKVHPAQDMSVIKLVQKSNIRLINDNDINKYGYSLYSFMGQVDACLSDYSSVYYDFLLTSKPIGLVIDDLHTYSENRGIIFEDYKENIKGFYIEVLDDLYTYIEEISQGIDSTKEMREEARERFCSFTDFKSTERVCNFIEEKLRQLK